MTQYASCYAHYCKKDVSAGLAYPPLYFYSGGVREFLATIKQHVLLVRLVSGFVSFLLFSSKFLFDDTITSKK